MRSIWVLVLGALLVGCGGESSETEDAGSAAGESAAAERVLIEVDEPEPLEVPEPKTVASETDWEAKVHNKEIEVIEVINIINPVAAYITAGFERYGDKFSPTLQEEWGDTQAQLTKALSLYDSCKKRKETGTFDKQHFLDMEEVWQLLVKTGVAGVRAKSMVDAEANRIVG
jgi:hypothetical protein